MAPGESRRWSCAAATEPRRTKTGMANMMGRMELPFREPIRHCNRDSGCMFHLHGSGP
jgi:hypothetical protein